MSRSSAMYSPHLIRIHPDGTGTAILGGAEFTVDEGTTQATREHLIRLCISYAEETGARTLIRLEDPDDSAEFIEADPSGAVRPVQLQPSSESDADLEVGDDHKHARRARTRRGSTRLSLPALSSGARLPSPRPAVTMLIVGAVLAIMLALALLTVFDKDGKGAKDASPVAVQTGTTLPQRPPLEWRREALWASPALLPEAQKVAVIDGTLVGMVTADRRVAVVGDDAQTRWTAPLPEGVVHSPLTLAMIDGTRVLAIHVGSQLVWWPVEGGEQKSAGLPSEEAPVTWRGDTPLIGTGGTTVAIVRDGQLAQVDVPQGARAVSGWTDGHVVAASSTGWWRLSPGQPAGRETPWQTPAKTPDSLTVIDGMGPYIVTAQPIGKKGVQAVIHQDTPEGVVRVMAGEVPGAKAGEALTWRPSSSRTWGILGTAIVDVEKAAVTDIGRPFTVSHVIADRALGTLGQQQVVVSPDAPTGVLQDGESFPEEILGRNAVVRSQTADGQQQVYVLPPNPNVPTATSR